MNAPTMFQAAQRIGRSVRSVRTLEQAALEASDVSFEVSFLFGGQIKGERPRLFMVYSAGNFIECTNDTPYLQIGEHKYGKPVLDRASLQRRPLRRPQDRADLVDHTMRQLPASAPQSSDGPPGRL
jgi:predicted proteasome-type protease